MNHCSVLMIRVLFGLLTSSILIGCQHQGTLNRSYLNHPAMDFRNRQTTEPKGMLTGLDAVGSASSSGVCSTCVK